MKRALVIQPTEASAKLANEALSEMFAIEFTSDYENGSALASDSYFEIVICNVTEASFDEALAFVSRLKTFDHYLNSPVVILSETKNSDQLAKAFEIGCDEYLAFPVDAVEFKARIRARVRDLIPAPKTNYFWAADLRFCIGTLRVVATDDASASEFELTPNEFKILFLLSKHLNKTLTRDFILTEVWGQNMHVVARTVDKHICSLRRKLGKRSGYLVSVPNKGYMFHVQSPKQKQAVAHANILTSAS